MYASSRRRSFAMVKFESILREKIMSDLPGDLLYTDDHEWLRREDDGSVTIGITDHAQASLGDLVYVELPEVGSEVDAAGEMAVVESVKAAFTRPRKSSSWSSCEYSR